VSSLPSVSTASTRQRILRASRRLGIEPQLRAVQRTLEGGERRQTRLDDHHVGLLCAYTLRANSNCIDIGANVGRILEQFVRLAPHGEHIAFEPLPELAANLKTRFPAVEVRESALGRIHQADRQFVRVIDAPSRSGFSPAAAGDRRTNRLLVAVESLDDALPAGYVPSIVKVDVEGAELEVLEGAINTLQIHRPVVLFEHQPSSTSDSGDVFDLLAVEAGFSVFDLDGQGPYSRNGFLAVVQSRMRWNFVARPYL
jgi:FkbM family methyltransferase